MNFGRRKCRDLDLTLEDNIHIGDSVFLLNDKFVFLPFFEAYVSD
jgi:hypothetical protein